MTRRNDEHIVSQINDVRGYLCQTVQTQAAALSREISDVGHDTERQRGELADLINTSVAGLRDDNADLRNTLRAVQGDLSASRREVQQLRADLEALRRAAAEAAAAGAAAAAGVREAPGGTARGTAAEEADADAPAAGEGGGGAPPADSAPPPRGADGPAPGRSIDDLLGRAAGIAYAEVLCHRDTWAFLVERASREEHFRLPGDIDEADDGTVEADLSGRSLVAALEALVRVQDDDAASLGTRHMAATWYARIGDALLGLHDSEDAAVLAHAVGGRATGRTGAVVQIVIDDRYPAASEPDSGAAAA